MKFWYVTNAENKIYAGYSNLTGRAMWFSGDPVNYSEVPEILKRKRDARWLAQAVKYDPTAQWKEY